MRWVHSKNAAFLLVVIVPAVIGIGFPFSSTATKSSDQTVTEVLALSTINCFDAKNLFVLTTTDSKCSSDLTFLGDAPLTESATADGFVDEIHPLLLARFNVAQSFARADGVNLSITSGFRSLSRQKFLFDREVAIRGSETEAAKWVLPPQFSHHPQGLAIDVNYPSGPSEALWLEKNGSRFGLCRVYANEWWHFEGVIAPGQRCPAMAPNALVDIT